MRKSLLAGALVLTLATSACTVTRHIPRSIDGLAGPAIGRGNTTEPIDEIALGEELAGFEGYNMRARYVVVKPGGHIRIHDHTGRPAFSYVVNVPVTQHRSDHPGGGIAHDTGALTADNNIGHWWTNDTGETARWYVVDIYRTGGNAGE